MNILKIIVPLSCAILLCSCGTTAAQKEESSDSKKVDVVNESADSATKIFLKDYATVTFQGYDTVGTESKRSIDVEKMVQDYSDAFGGSNSTIISDVASSFDTFDVIPDKNLSNGDIVKLSLGEKYKEINNKYNVELIADNLEFTVTGLKELNEVDPFKNLIVKFDENPEDVGGNTRICHVSKGLEPSSDLKYKVDKEIANVGETVTVEYFTDYPDGSTVEERFAANGYKPTRIKIEYTVE